MDAYETMIVRSITALGAILFGIILFAQLAKFPANHTPDKLRAEGAQLVEIGTARMCDRTGCIER